MHSIILRRSKLYFSVNLLLCGLIIWLVFVGDIMRALIG